MSQALTTSMMLMVMILTMERGETLENHLQAEPNYSGREQKSMPVMLFTSKTATTAISRSIIPHHLFALSDKLDTNITYIAYTGHEPNLNLLTVDEYADLYLKFSGLHFRDAVSTGIASGLIYCVRAVM